MLANGLLTGWVIHGVRALKTPARRLSSKAWNSRDPTAPPPPRLASFAATPPPKENRRGRAPAVQSDTRNSDQAASTTSVAASARTTFTRLPAAMSGPARRQIESSIRTVPLPATIGFSSVNSRPTKASRAAIEERLIARLLDLPGDAAPERDRGDREDRERDELILPRPHVEPAHRAQHERNDTDEQRREAEPQHERAGRDQFEHEENRSTDQPVPHRERGEKFHHGTLLALRLSLGRGVAGRRRSRSTARSDCAVRAASARRCCHRRPSRTSPWRSRRYRRASRERRSPPSARSAPSGSARWRACRTPRCISAR